MDVIHIISVTFWIIVALHAVNVLTKLKDKGLSRREVTVITILLLSGLNIAKGILLFDIDFPQDYQGQQPLEYLYVGSVLFQLLLCNIVLRYFKTKKPLRD